MADAGVGGVIKRKKGQKATYSTTRSPTPKTLNPGQRSYSNYRDLITRIGLWGPLYSNYSKEPPKIV